MEEQVPLYPLLNETESDIIWLESCFDIRNIDSFLHTIPQTCLVCDVLPLLSYSLHPGIDNSSSRSLNVTNTSHITLSFPGRDVYVITMTFINQQDEVF